MEKQKWSETDARRHISPTSDIFVRYLFASRGNADITKSFINAVLEDAGRKRIASVKITSPFNLRKSIHDKESIMDVKVLDTDGRSYDVEIQNITTREIMERLAYYGTRMYSEQLGDSQQYTELKHCTVIGLLKGHIFGFGQAVKPQEKMHHVSENVHYDDHEMPFYPDGDPVVCHILERDRFANNADALYTVNGDGKQRKLTPELFGWLRFFTAGAAEDFMEKYADTDSCIKKAKKEYEKFIKTQRLREAQLRHDMWLHDRAQEKYDAREEGRAEGSAAGREMGLSEGRAEGARETTLVNARNLKTLGVSVQIIAQATGLTEDEIAKL